MVAAYHGALARTAGAGASNGRWGSMRWSDRALWSVGIRIWRCTTRSAARAIAVSQLQLWCTLSWVQPPASPPPRPVALCVAAAIPLMHHLSRLHHPFTHCVQTAGEVEVFPERMEVNLSMILKWYGRDFGSKADLLRFLVQHLPPGEGAAQGGRVGGWGGWVGLASGVELQPGRAPVFVGALTPCQVRHALPRLLCWRGRRAGTCRGRFPAQTHNLPATCACVPRPTCRAQTAAGGHAGAGARCGARHTLHVPPLRLGHKQQVRRQWRGGFP